MVSILVKVVSRFSSEALEETLLILVVVQELVQLTNIIAINVSFVD